MRAVLLSEVSHSTEIGKDLLMNDLHNFLNLDVLNHLDLVPSEGMAWMVLG